MKCQWCEIQIPSGKEFDMLIISSNKKPFKFGEQIILTGHKNCLIPMANAYKRFGKIISLKESELESFNTLI